MSCFTQEIDDYYGADWDGPVPVDAEEVRVASLSEFLSSAEKETLSQHLAHPEVLTEEMMIQNFTVAKTFVHSACDV